MCGICGVWNYESIIEDDKKLVEDMNKCQKHRGPDDEGCFCDSNVVLGHRRLAIIDLSTAGHQPMHFKERFWIVYNGELFNYIEIRQELKKKKYTFYTNSDTEVVCAAYDCWGTKCFEKFNGFWALAIYDKKEKVLCLSRDRYGIKPLYYYKRENKIIFASEIKAILCDSTVNRRVNENVISDYLIYGLSDYSEETFFENIYSVPTATYSIVDKAGELVFEKYYKLNINYSLKDKGDENEIVKFRELFEKSVELRLRSDVEIGACLSGGLDSSAIVCKMSELYRRKNKSFKTFSVCFKGFKLDESEYVNEVLNYTGIGGEKITPHAGEFWDNLDELIYLADQPFGGPSSYAVYSLMKHIHQKGIKVLLDGQGADEILCGYRKSRLYLVKKLFRNKKYFSAFQEIIHSITQFTTSDNIHMDVIKVLNIFSKKAKNKNLFIKKGYTETKFDYTETDFIYNDISKISLPSILRMVDRTSMAFSIEDRLPFLDYNLVDYSIALPLHSKMKNGWSKHIMRQALDLPEKIKFRKTKIGFAPPEEQWLKELEKDILKVFTNSDFRAGKYIDRKEIVENWEKIISHPMQIPLFRFLCLEKWMQIYNIKN